MNDQWGARRRGEECTAGVEVKTSSNHHEEKHKQAEHQRGLFNFTDHNAPPVPLTG
jgi:hypothetical protein